MNGLYAEFRLDAQLASAFGQPFDALAPEFRFRLAVLGLRLLGLPLRIGDSRSPPVAIGVIFLPQLPDLARMLGQKIFARKAHGHGKAFRALPHQHHVPGMLHHGLRHFGNILDIAHAPHRTRAPGWTMHAASIEFNHALFVRQAAETDAVIIGIVFRAGHDQDRRIERVTALAQMLVSTVEVCETVIRAHDDRTLSRTGLGSIGS